MTESRPAPSGTDADGGVKAVLHWYLRKSRQTLRWKLEGLTERQLRMPMTPTGTNLLGLLKHLASVEVGYFTDCMGRPTSIEVPWFAEDAEPNGDMYATAEESLEQVLAFADRCAAEADEAIEALDLDASGRVPWWSQPDVTLGRLLTHMVDEYARHLGHVDIVRELLDGQAGLMPGNSNLPSGHDSDDERWWSDFTGRLRQIAEQF